MIVLMMSVCRIMTLQCISITLGIEREAKSYLILDDITFTLMQYLGVGHF